MAASELEAGHTVGRSPAILDGCAVSPPHKTVLSSVTGKPFAPLDCPVSTLSGFITISAWDGQPSMLYFVNFL